MRSLSAITVLVDFFLLLSDLVVDAEGVPTLCLLDLPSKLDWLEISSGFLCRTLRTGSVSSSRKCHLLIFLIY